MNDINDLNNALNEYAIKYRRSDLPPLVISKLFDLFPQNGSAHPDVTSSWPKKWPNSDFAGVYIFLNEKLELLYIGKSSMKNSLGARLSTYFVYDDLKRCKLVDQNWIGEPRYIMTIAVPSDMRFEAPALEEFLISSLRTTDNKAGV